MKKILIIITIVFNSCISPFVRKHFSKEVKADKVTYDVLSRQEPMLDKTMDFTYEVRNRKSVFFFTIDNNAGPKHETKLRVLLFENLLSAELFRDSLMYERRQKVDLTTNHDYDGIIVKAKKYDSLFKVAQCNFYSYPRYGHNLLYKPTSGPNIGGTHEFHIAGHWYYSLEKYNNRERRKFKVLFSREFNLDDKQ
jgi:hypothetical protein